jgi:hypothetical protein
MFGLGPPSNKHKVCNTGAAQNGSFRLDKTNTGLAEIELEETEGIERNEQRRNIERERASEREREEQLIQRETEREERNVKAEGRKRYGKRKRYL